MIGYLFCLPLFGKIPADLFASFDGKKVVHDTMKNGVEMYILYDGDIIGGTDGHEGFRMIKWDGTDPDGQENFAGDYIIRWMLEDGYRDYAVKVVE